MIRLSLFRTLDSLLTSQSHGSEAVNNGYEVRLQEGLGNVQPVQFCLGSTTGTLACGKA
jgi:hypothetical protein